jgi:hypothetical protein
MLRLSIDSRGAKEALKRTTTQFRKALRGLKPYFSGVVEPRMRMIVQREFTTRGMGSWAPASPLTILRRQNAGRPFTQMMDTTKLLGKMLNQVHSSATQTRLKITDKKVINHFGGIIKVPEVISKKPLPIFKAAYEPAWGKNFKTVPGGFVIFRRHMKAHDINIPKRPLFRFRPADINYLHKELGDFIVKRVY